VIITNLIASVDWRLLAPSLLLTESEIARIIFLPSKERSFDEMALY
jgi:hypothetical protein